MDRENEFLLRALLSLRTPEEAQSLLDDILTPHELDELCLRLDIARRLHAGQTYEAISQETGASSTTISRVRRCLFRGAGGYRSVLDRLQPRAGARHP